jgi:quinol monooxygenase YgiN
MKRRKTMAYVRVSTMTPSAGREAEAAQINRKLITFYRDQPGCLHTTYLRAVDGSNQIGRVTFWETSAHADRAALAERSIYLRSRLHLVIQNGYEDRSFETESAEAPALAAAV